MLWIFIAIIASYLLGSIPSAYIFGRLLKGIDIRKAGSGNVGATNALRVLGKGPGAAVLAIDILKGFISVFFLAGYFATKASLIDEQNLRIILGLSCICGHNWTVFLQFKGGKGIAATFGVLLGLALKISGLKIVVGALIFIWFIVFFFSRIVSLSSVLAGLALPVLLIFFQQPILLISLGIVLAIFVILRHKPNITRILQGKEPRLNFSNPKKH